MRIELDTDLCQGHAMCEDEAPEVFEVPKHGPARLLTAEPDESMRREVEAAVRFCPTRALRLTD